MADVLVIGKKISEMGLVSEITGEEKIPTGVQGDKAVTTGQLLTYLDNNGKVQWGRIEGDITNQADLQNQFTQDRNTAKSYTQDLVSQQQVALQEHIDIANEVFEYTRDNGSALPYKEGIAYEDGAVVVKDGVLQQWKGGEWKSAIESELAEKADKSYVDTVRGESVRFYQTLTEANADIENLTVNQAVNVGEVENGGLWYKATSGAASLTKSPYDTKIRNELDALPFEDGVLSDTFVTATADGVNAAVRTQRDKNSDTVSVKDFATPQDGVNYLKSKGGGELYFPFGDYPCQVLIDSPNIKLRGEKGTILRSGGTGSVVDVAAGAFDFELDGFDIRGQNLATEGKSNANNTVTNTNSLHCIRIREKGARLRNFKTSAARYDGLYVEYRGDVDLEVENFYIGSTARNPLSWIAGSNARFKNGHFFLDNQYTGAHGGLYLVDFEPNSVADQYSNISFEDVNFESITTQTGGRYLILQDTNQGDGNDLNVRLKNCNFLNTDGQYCGIRLKADTPIKEFRGLHMEDTTFSARALTILSGTQITLKNSTLRNITTGENATFGVTFGDGCLLENFKTNNGSVGSIDLGTGAQLKNVYNKPDTILNSMRVQALDVNGDVKYNGNFTGADCSVYTKAISVADVGTFTNVVQLGTRGSFKVTIAGCDATTGKRAEHISESWVVVSDNTATQAPINFILNSETTGLDVEWLAASGSSIGARTLKVKPREAVSNQFIVRVEVFGANTGFNNVPVTWLI